MNNLYWALDVSTTNIGMALFDSAGNLLELKHLQLKIKRVEIPLDRLINKVDLFRDYIFGYIELIEKKYNGKIAKIYIEEPLKGSKNINTAILLQKFNGMVCYLLYEILKIYPSEISVNESRKIFCPELVVKTFNKKKNIMIEVLSFPKNIDKKDYIWKRVADVEKGIQWIYDRNSKLKDESYDMSDAYCVGYSSMKRDGII
jgi:hypothetical protein